MVPLTPTPLNNVNSFPNKTILPKLLPFTFSPSPIIDKSKLKGILPEPVRAAGIPQTAKWLAGEGAGSWFTISHLENEKYAVSRFAPDGKLECEGEFAISNNQPFNVESLFLIGYLSHCGKVTIIQNGFEIKLIRIKKMILEKANTKKGLYTEDVPQSVKKTLKKSMELC